MHGSSWLIALLQVFLTLYASRAEQHNVPLEGFTALFNGRDLSGWHGMGHFDPRKLAAMNDDERAAEREADTASTLQHWRVEGGELVNDGRGAYLTTDRKFGDIELLVDYKTVPKSDSGIYLRATPQVQIWDYTEEGGEIRWRNLFIREIPAEEANRILACYGDEAFQPVFNGQDLTGWTGAVESYEVRDEVQILDSEHPRCANLDRRQHHGSAYGMVAAHRGFLRETGEWSFQEVTVQGSKIRVELNGSVILDADLGTVTEFMGDRPYSGEDLPRGSGETSQRGDTK